MSPSNFILSAEISTCLTNQHLHPRSLVVHYRTAVREIVSHRRAHYAILFTVVNFFYRYSRHIRSSFVVHNSTAGWHGSPASLQENYFFVFGEFFLDLFNAFIESANTTALASTSFTGTAFPICRAACVKELLNIKSSGNVCNLAASRIEIARF